MLIIFIFELYYFNEESIKRRSVAINAVKINVRTKKNLTGFKLGVSEATL